MSILLCAFMGVYVFMCSVLCIQSCICVPGQTCKQAYHIHTLNTHCGNAKKKGEKKGSQGLGNVLILSVVCGLEKAYDMKMFPELLC